MAMTMAMTMATTMATIPSRSEQSRNGIAAGACDPMGPQFTPTEALPGLVYLQTLRSTRTLRSEMWRLPGYSHEPILGSVAPMPHVKLLLDENLSPAVAVTLRDADRAIHGSCC